MALGRALRRYDAQHDSIESVREAYERRCIPGQKLFLDETRPKEIADAVVDNNDLCRPVLNIGSPS